MTERASQLALESAYRDDGRRVLATLVRLLGDFDAAEEAMHDAFAVAATEWATDGVPASPYAWLVSTARFRHIDRKRRAARWRELIPDVIAHGEAETDVRDEIDTIRDDELRLIFACCHPAIPPDARVALTLRAVAGLTTEEIARGFVVPSATIAQRIVRAKTRIREDAIPYEVPPRNEWPARIESVLRVIYLVFNEGYSATSGATLVRNELCADALRLARLAAELLDDSEADGLLALLLLHDARRATRVDAEGNIVLLEDQDRSRWDRPTITEANARIDRAMQSRRVGPYVLQAAIASLHAEARTVEETDWKQIVALYDVLQRVEPSPVVRLNRAAAIGMRDGPAEGLRAIDAAMSSGDLDAYHLAHAARAELLRRLGRIDEAQRAYERALSLCEQEPERRFLRTRIERLTNAKGE